MSRASIIICLLLILGKREVTAKITYGIEEAIDDIGSFIPGAKFVLTTAVKLWLLYGDIQELIQPNTTRIENELVLLEQKLDEITLKMDKLSDKMDNIESDIKDLKYIINDKVVMGLPKEINLIQIRDYFYQSLVNKMLSMYQLFLLYNDHSIVYSKETHLQFAESIVDPHINQLTSVLNQIKDLFVNTGGSYNVLNLLVNKHLAETLICSKQESPLHQITIMYRDAMVTEVKSLAMIQYAYKKKSELSLHSEQYKAELDMAKNTSYRRCLEISRKVKAAMLLASEDYFICDLPLPIEGSTYAKIGPVFQRYLLQENGFDDGKSRGYNLSIFRGCGGSCKSRRNGTDVCTPDTCPNNERRCSGRVLDCETFQPTLAVCLSDRTSDRRYEYLEAQGGEDSGKYFGKKKTCGPGRSRIFQETNRFRLINYKYLICEYCLCTCLADEAETDIDRYFSLRDVTADVQDNKIVTGVKFTKKNKILHIQVLQGILINNGNIDQKSVSWKNVDDFSVLEGENGKDYHAISWDERSVYLDDFKSETNTVLTGLRFQRSYDGIKLEIRVTPFDFSTGKLQVSESRWLPNSDNVPRSQLSLENRALPSTLEYQYLDSTDKQFFKFTTSSVEDDAGQTVVPYIDLQPVETKVSLPLAGAGLIYKSHDEDSAGFLAFKLYTYNYGPHLQD